MTNHPRNHPNRRPTRRRHVSPRATSSARKSKDFPAILPGTTPNNPWGDKLKLCPWCDGQPHVTERDGQWHVTCWRRMCRYVIGKTPEYAQELWNEIRTAQKIPMQPDYHDDLPCPGHAP